MESGQGEGGRQAWRRRKKMSDVRGVAVGGKKCQIGRLCVGGPHHPPFQADRLWVSPHLGAQTAGRPEVPSPAAGALGEGSGKGNGKFGLRRVSLRSFQTSRHDVEWSMSGLQSRVRLRISVWARLAF